MNLFKYYRVQGGTGYSKSREMIKTTDEGILDIKDILKKIHIGDERHNRSFLKIRSTEKWRETSLAEFDQEEKVVIQMYFPEFFSKLIRKVAIPEYISTDKNPKAPPHVVDINQGEAYATYGAWNALLESCCVYARSITVKDPEEIERYYNEEPPKLNPVNIVKLTNFLKQTKSNSNITDADFNQIVDDAMKFNRQLKEKDSRDDDAR